MEKSSEIQIRKQDKRQVEKRRKNIMQVVWGRRRDIGTRMGEM